MGEESPAPPKTAKQLEKEAKKAAEKAAKLEKLAGLWSDWLTVRPFWPTTNISAKQAKITAAKAGGDDDKKEKKPKKEPGPVKEAAVYDGMIDIETSEHLILVTL